MLAERFAHVPVLGMIGVFELHLHSSRRNRTVDSFRMALVNHYMRAESMLPWDQDGKPPLTEDLRDIVIVAGKDPYAWRKIVDVNKPSLRPDTPRAKERTRQYDE